MSRKWISERGQRLVITAVGIGLALLSLYVLRPVNGTRFGKQSDDLPAQRDLPLNVNALAIESKTFPSLAKVAFVRSDSVYVYDLQSKQLQFVGEGYDPDISPDGRVVAFTVNRDELEPDTTIRFFNLETSGLLDLPSISGLNVRNPCWSRDGKQIAFDAILGGTRHVAIMNVVTGQLRYVTQGLGSRELGLSVSSWISDDLVLCHDLQNIYEISVNGNMMRRIPIETLGGRSDVSSSTKFQLSRDKTLLLFDGGRHPLKTHIYLFDFRKGKLRNLAPEIDASEPRWLPSEKEILFTCGKANAPNEPSDICTMSLDDNKLRTLLRNASAPSFSTR